MDQDTLTRIHGIMLELLDEFVRICEENNFTYFLLAGTLLGAVRHKGFIPWDDDLDVAMPRADYNRFLDYCQNNNIAGYYLVSERDPYKTHFHYSRLAKLCKRGTLYATKSRKPRDYPGIYIDIFAYDNCKLFLLPLRTWLYNFTVTLYSRRTYDYLATNKIKMFIQKTLLRLIPEKVAQLFRPLSMKLCTAFNDKDTGYITFFTDTDGYKVSTHKVSTIFPLTKLCFEGKEYCAPGDWNTFLSTTFGNYMELPPVEKRKAHCQYVVFDTSEGQIDYGIEITSKRGQCQ